MKAKRAIVTVEIEYYADTEKDYKEMVKGIKKNFYYGSGGSGYDYDRKKVLSVEKMKQTPDTKEAGK